MSEEEKLQVGKIGEVGMVSAPAVSTPEQAEAQAASTGWKPPRWLPWVVVGVGGGLAAALPFATGPFAVALTIAIGVLGSVAGAMGISSAGTAGSRK